MTEIYLRLIENPAEESIEKGVINNNLSDINEICSNPLRAAIVHILLNSPQTGYSASVEQLAYRLGTYHRVVIHHLERLEKWEIVKVRRMKTHGAKTRRSIWGLNLQYPNWLFEVYENIKSSYSEDDLKKISSINSKLRKNN